MNKRQKNQKGLKFIATDDYVVFKKNENANLQNITNENMDSEFLGALIARHATLNNRYIYISIYKYIGTYII